MNDLKLAHELRKRKKYDEALAICERVWETEQETAVAAATVNCLRNLGRLDEAEEFLDEAQKVCPPSTWLDSERAWTIYVKYIKPCDVGDKREFMEKANRLFELTNDFLPRKITAFKVTDILAKGADANWREVRNWLESIKHVERESPAPDPGRRMSDKKKWYFKYTRALEKLGDFDRCQRYCVRARKMFKKDFYFRHRAARCAGALKDYDRAYAEYDALLNRYDDWFLYYDIAKLRVETENMHVAESLVIEAILRCRVTDLKISTYLFWAKLLESNDAELAWVPINFYVKYRENRGWPISEEARRIEKDHPVPESEGDLDLQDLEDKVGQLLHIRRKEYIPRACGMIKNLREKYGFIRGADGLDYFFSRTAVRGEPQVGMQVVFRIRKGYDKKKKKESLVAHDVMGL